MVSVGALTSASNLPTSAANIGRLCIQPYPGGACWPWPRLAQAQRDPERGLSKPVSQMDPHEAHATGVFLGRAQAAHEISELRCDLDMTSAVLAECDAEIVWLRAALKIAQANLEAGTYTEAAKNIIAAALHAGGWKIIR